MSVFATSVGSCMQLTTQNKEDFVYVTLFSEKRIYYLLKKVTIFVSQNRNPTVTICI